MGRKTPLHDQHEDMGARLVDFAGWDMPLHYGSQIDEHHAVRKTAGMFDVSHMAVVDIRGHDARDCLRRLWANDVARIDTVGRAFYTCMLNADGGVIDDLIVYHTGDDEYRTVLNAGTTDTDLAWMHKQADGFDVAIEHRTDLAIIAVQGPEARQLATEVIDESTAERAMQLKPFEVTAAGDWMVARTGYTGEDGFELIVPDVESVMLWRMLDSLDIMPAGLGARDTLRLEAGLNLYGQDMDEDHHPFESGLGWTVDLRDADRDFIGREAIEHIDRQPEDERHKLVGLILEDRGVIRTGQTVRLAGDEAGETAGIVTSGGYAPTLACSIACARVPGHWQADTVEVQVRRKWLTARVVSRPFVRNGKAADN